jgi:hypothetical protein
MLADILRLIPHDWYVHLSLIYFSFVPASLESWLRSTTSSIFRGSLHLAHCVVTVWTLISVLITTQYLSFDQKMSTQVGASVPPAGITPNFDQPQDVLYTINFLVEILCIALVVTFVSLRIYVRACMMRQIEKEDCKYLPHFDREYRLNDLRGVCCGRGIFSKWHNLLSLC